MQLDIKRSFSRHKLSRLVLIVLIVIAGVVLYFIFKGDKQASGDLSNSSSSIAFDKKVQDKCINQIHDQTFCKFAGSFAKAGSYKVEASVTDAQNGVSSLQISIDSQGNSSLVASSNGKNQGTIVVYNKETYIKDPSDSSWIKYSSSDQSSAVSDLKQQYVGGDFNKNSEGKPIGYKKIGQEPCGSLQCYKYKLTDSSQASYLLFDTTNYLLRKVSVDASGSKTEMTVSYEPVKISQPSPVKPLQ